MFPRPLSRPTPRPAFLNPQRTLANRLPRPPPKDLPPPETFSSTSRPRQYYSRPHPRDLPPYRVSAEHLDFAPFQVFLCGEDIAYVLPPSRVYI